MRFKPRQRVTMTAPGYRDQKGYVLSHNGTRPVGKYSWSPVETAWLVQVDGETSARRIQLLGVNHDCFLALVFLPS